ncbi:solute carrier family 35 member C2 [Amblyraja radiata]|uniref:solute carrier family 35 member C2 n=1 Tax=Amblyraja radiata TaxID=386614 RepID=UPI001402767E|nr:solute carrier family 35 member C2 [Amblyraja radiata]
MTHFDLYLSFIRKASLTVLLVIFYYCFSIGITFYNKWVMKRFHYPIFMTLVHLAMTFVLSGISRTLVSWYTGKPHICLSWKPYLKRVAATALATALDIGLSNWSFMFITISLYTMTKSTAVLFILFFAIIFKLEKLRSWLLIVIVLIAGGLFMFTYKSTQFNTEGFILVLIASFLGGIRWTLTQILTQKADLGLQNPIDTMYHLQPLMFIGLFPLFVFNEGLSLSASEKLFRYHETSALLNMVFVLAGGGFLAFGLCFSEFLLVAKTSSLTLSIAGIFKEVCVLILASHLMGDQLTLLNWLGFVMCLSGISLHVALKVTYSEDSSKDTRMEKFHDVALTEVATELLLRNGQANESDEDEVVH